MKKEYIKPSIKVHQIRNVDIICGSGGSSAKMYGDGFSSAEVSQYGDEWGIWGE